MNLIFLIAALGVSLVAAYMVNDWASTHGLAILVGDTWAMQAKGWPAVWPTISVGLLVGTVLGITIGTVLSGRLAQALEAQKDEATEKAQKALSKQRQELAAKSARIDAEIKNAIAIATANSQEWVETHRLEAESNRIKALQLERKIDTLEKRMKGSQQKAARLKKAQLKSV
ncbi:hypothetical protein [Giesbergeria anulus]|uniref:Lipopolysaccharide assembly protein A domain-containing protein n=1 Tax=Giesbergeria anulus TaxID=180197 RepID=A0A1H9SW10_9BURK|nr:hypothetical protein [Giesbergeria anulus]SER89027.1 hypothetical protein SAMN02982919_03237 [Giesbergeria anulus]